MEEVKKHGGRRAGAGKKLQNPEFGKRLTRAITVRPDLDAAIAHDRSGIIEKALEMYLSQKN